MDPLLPTVGKFDINGVELTALGLVAGLRSVALSFCGWVVT